jgi:hypothetical protein
MSRETALSAAFAALEGLLAAFLVCAAVYGTAPMGGRLMMLGVALFALVLMVNLAHLTAEHRELDL